MGIASLSNLKNAHSGALLLHTQCVQGTDACKHHMRCILDFARPEEARDLPRSGDATHAVCSSFYVPDQGTLTKEAPGAHISRQPTQRGSVPQTTAFVLHPK